MLQRTLDKIWKFLVGPLMTKLQEIAAAIQAIGAEQRRQSAVLDQHSAILEEIRAAVVNDQAVNIEIVEGPPEEQP